MRGRLLLVIALLALAAPVLACGGGGGVDLNKAATAAANATPSTELSITAKSLKFDKQALVSPANREATIHLDNQENGVLHNIAFYRSKDDLTEVIHRSEAFEGSKAADVRFTTPAAGVFYFRCDVHPEMNGVFIVK